MSNLLVTVFTPLAGALLLPMLRRLPWAGWLNVLVSAISLAASIRLALDVAAYGVVANSLLRVDAFNVYLLVLTAFVGLTTSIFSRPYMRYVFDIGPKTVAPAFNQQIAAAPRHRLGAVQPRPQRPQFGLDPRIRPGRMPREQGIGLEAPVPRRRVFADMQRGRRQQQGRPGIVG